MFLITVENGSMTCNFHDENMCGYYTTENVIQWSRIKAGPGKYDLTHTYQTQEH